MNAIMLLADSQSMFDSASPGSESIRSLSVLVLAITGFIFIVVEGVLLYSIVRFRRPPPVCWCRCRLRNRRKFTAASRLRSPGTAAPAPIVSVLVLVTTRTLWEVPGPPRPSRSSTITPFLSRSSAISGGGNTATITTTANKRSASPPPTNCVSRQAAKIFPGPFTSRFEIGRRVPQLRRAAAGGQDRSDSGPHQSNVAADR